MNRYKYTKSIMIICNCLLLMLWMWMMHLGPICFYRLGWIEAIGIIRLDSRDGFFRVFSSVLGFSLWLSSYLFREGCLVMRWIRELLSFCFTLLSKIESIFTKYQRTPSMIFHHSPKSHKISNSLTYNSTLVS